MSTLPPGPSQATILGANCSQTKYPPVVLGSQPEPLQASSAQQPASNLCRSQRAVVTLARSLPPQGRAHFSSVGPCVHMPGAPHAGNRALLREAHGLPPQTPALAPHAPLGLCAPEHCLLITRTPSRSIHLVAPIPPSPQPPQYPCLTSGGTPGQPPLGQIKHLHSAQTQPPLRTGFISICRVPPLEVAAQVSLLSLDVHPRSAARGDLAK